MQVKKLECLARWVLARGREHQADADEDGQRHGEQIGAAHLRRSLPQRCYRIHQCQRDYAETKQRVRPRGGMVKQGVQQK
jgi:hypothetical protein